MALIEIDGLPMNSTVIFHGKLLYSHNQRVNRYVPLPCFELNIVPPTVSPFLKGKTRGWKNHSLVTSTWYPTLTHKGPRVKNTYFVNGRWTNIANWLKNKLAAVKPLVRTQFWKTTGSDTILNKTIMANAFAAPKLWHNPLKNAWMLDDVG